jgi:hypothetical protein
MQESRAENSRQLEDALLERIRKEREEEVISFQATMQDRAMEFAERRKNLLKFFENGTDFKTGQSSGQEMTGSSSTNPATTNETSTDEADNENSPPAVLVEIRALVESRPVSSILGTSLYRRQLEEIIRVSGAQAIASAARFRAQQANRQSSEQRNVTPDTTASPVAQPSANVPVNNSQSQGSEEVFIPYNREQIQEEIENLMQQGLVSQLLQSDFSETLSHLILSLPSTATRFNNNLPLINSDDSISIISASAQTIPHSQTTSVLARQVGDLRNEVNELKTMIRLLMDAQLETQRCIRQEMAPFLGSGPSTNRNEVNSSTNRTHFEVVRGRGNCLICMNNPADMLIYRCGHLCMCHMCSLQLQHYQERPHCPVCRGRITDIVRVFSEDNDVNE